MSDAFEEEKDLIFAQGLRTSEIFSHRFPNHKQLGRTHNNNSPVYGKFVPENRKREK
jgi:hypothetical protein